MATFYNFITCELEAGALSFICSLFFSVGGYVTTLTFLTLKFFPLSKDLCDNPLLSPLLLLWFPCGECRKMLFYCSPISFLNQSRLCSPRQTGNTKLFFVAQTCSVQEPGTSCVVKAMVASFICGALRVRSRLKLSPQHWADICSLQPQSEGGWGHGGSNWIYTPLFTEEIFLQSTDMLYLSYV